MITDLLDRILIAFGGRVTTRSATEQFGPTPGARYAAQLSHYTDTELVMRDRDEILAEITSGPRATSDAPRGREATLAAFRARIADELRQAEDEILASAANLDDRHTSVESKIIRQVAQQIRDRREVAR